jgi:hypothetical protein
MSRRCCVPDCSLPVITSGHGFDLPVCSGHYKALPGPIQRKANEAAAGSPYDPQAVVAAMAVVVRVKVHFGQVPRKAKRKP